MAKKTTPKPLLNKVDKFYIENNKSIPASELAKDLGKTQKVVKAYLQEIDKSSGMKVDKLMAKNERGSVVMTQQASSLADSKKKPTTPPKKTKSCIHKIRD